MVSDKVITEEEEAADTRGVQHVISSSAGDAEREGCHHHPGAYLHTKTSTWIRTVPIQDRKYTIQYTKRITHNTYNNKVTLCNTMLMLFQCWATVFDAGPTLQQHWISVPCLLGICCVGSSHYLIICHYGGRFFSQWFSDGQCIL